MKYQEVENIVVSEIQRKIAKQLSDARKAKKRATARRKTSIQSHRTRTFLKAVGN